MPSSDRSGYTPPLEETRRSRVSRSPYRRKLSSRKRSGSPSPAKRYRKRRGHSRKSRLSTWSKSSSTLSESSSRDTTTSSSMSQSSHDDQSIRTRKRRRRSRRSHNQSVSRHRSRRRCADHLKRRRTSSKDSLRSISGSSREHERSRPKVRAHKGGKRQRFNSTDHSEEKSFLKQIARMMGKGSNNFEGAHNVIPEFDPDSHSQTARDWIRKVNETAHIYGWSERQIIYHAIPKLAGQAKKWCQGRRSVDLSWRQWQRKIVKTFPDDRNYADRLTEMLSRRSKRRRKLLKNTSTKRRD